MNIQKLIGKGPKVKGRKRKAKEAAEEEQKEESSSISLPDDNVEQEAALRRPLYTDVSAEVLLRLEKIDAKIASGHQLKSVVADLKQEVKAYKAYMDERDKQRAIAMAELTKRRSLGADELRISAWSRGDLQLLRAPPVASAKKAKNTKK